MERAAALVLALALVVPGPSPSPGATGTSRRPPAAEVRTGGRDRVARPAITAHGGAPAAHPAPTAIGEARGALPAILANANRVPAGRLERGVLTVRLVARRGYWSPEESDGGGLDVEAFAEEGGPPLNPGPLIRVPEGTVIRASVRNALPAETLVVHGLDSRPGTDADTLQVAPGAVRA